MIYIIDGQYDDILDFITLEHIIDDAHKKSLEKTLETYDFIAFGEEDYANYLKERNRLIIPDEDGTLREFVLREVEKYVDSEGRKVQVFADASYLDLRKANVIVPNSYKGTASQHAGRALLDTGWEVGKVEVSGNITITIEKHISPYENLRRIANEFNGELDFRIEHDGRKVTRRYVDIVERIGSWTGRLAEMGYDLDTINRKETQDVVTALLGLAPEREDGTRLEVLVEDEDALQRWGRVDKHGEIHHLIEAYEIESERTEMTEEEARRYTRTALDKRINTQVSYECEVVDLEHVKGMENKKIRFGDSIRIKDTAFNPPLYVEARVYEMTRSIKTTEKKSIKLGDFIEYTEDEVNAIWQQLRDEIANRLNKLVIVTVVSDGGDVFKNGEGSTELTAKTFVNGVERDIDGTLYDYQWMKFDKDGEHVTTFYEEGKTISVNASDIDEKATYRVLVAYNLEVVNTYEITLSNVYDGVAGEKGEDGKDGKDGEDGSGSYSNVAYANSPDGTVDFSLDDSEDKEYIGTFTYEFEGRRNYALTLGGLAYEKYFYSGIMSSVDSNETYSYKVFSQEELVSISFNGFNGETFDEGIVFDTKEGTFSFPKDYSQVTVIMEFEEDIDPEEIGKSFAFKVVKGSEVKEWTPAPEDFINDPSNYKWQKVKGDDGKSSYTHIRYSMESDGSNMSTDPTDAVYIGIGISESPVASGDKEDYEWSKIKGEDGVSGGKGEDGRTSYVHIKYSNDGGNTFTSNNGEDPGDYIGTYTDFTQADSNNVNDYTWAKVKGDKGDKGDPGIKGDKGADGQSQYVHIRYSANANGNPMTTTPNANTQYIGLANTTSSTAPTSYTSYTWSRTKGETGNQGIPGSPGADGQTTYTWVKYADSANGSGISDSPEGKKYIGLAFNKTTPTESNNAGDYQWSLMPQNITVGGVNLIHYTRPTDTNVSEWVSIGSYTSLSTRQIEGYDYIRLGISSDVQTGNYPRFRSKYVTRLIHGKTYTVSWKAFHSNYVSDEAYGGIYNNSGIIRQNFRNAKRELVRQFEVSNNMRNEYKYTFTFTFNDPEADDRLYGIYLGAEYTRQTPAAAWVYFRDIKIEEGDVATSWSPSPEDVQRELDQAKQDALNAQTTADGKNTIFQQNTQPSTVGRKVGDTWFKTNADNRMYRFNGTSWVQAGFGEQAIVADSITANHIKSLNGLNVNDQFIVDNNGNVTFSGDMVGGTIEATEFKSNKTQSNNFMNSLVLNDAAMVFSQYNASGTLLSSIEFSSTGIDGSMHLSQGYYSINLPQVSFDGLVLFRGEVSINNNTSIKGNLSMSEGFIYTNAVDINTGTHLYIRTSSTSGEVRVTATNSTTNLRPLRASTGIFEGGLSINGVLQKDYGGGTHIYIRTAGEVRATEPDSTSSYINMRALGFLPPSSTRETKKGIDIISENVLDNFRDSNVYSFLYEWEDDECKKHIGLMLDESPDCIVAESEDTLDMYSTIGYLWKGIKDIINEMDDLRDEVNKLKEDK